MKKISFLVIVLAISLLSGSMMSCKKDKDSEPAPAPRKPTLASNQQVVTVPTRLQTSQDPNAQMANSYLQQINAMTNFSAYFTPPSTATHTSSKSTNSEIWTWTISQPDQNNVMHNYTFTYTFTQTTEKYIWNIRLSVDGGTTYNFMSAEERIDGTSGNMYIYYDALSGVAGTDLSNIYYYYNWTKATNGTITVNMEWHQGATSLFKYVAIVNADGSGEIAYYNGNIISFRLTWTATGTGSYYTYDENGNLISSGQWV